jgi:hypothetical protein
LKTFYGFNNYRNQLSFFFSDTICSSFQKMRMDTIQLSLILILPTSKDHASPIVHHDAIFKLPSANLPPNGPYKEQLISLNQATGHTY